LKIEYSIEAGFYFPGDVQAKSMADPAAQTKPGIKLVDQSRVYLMFWAGDGDVHLLPALAAFAECRGLVAWSRCRRETDRAGLH
jgi:hypothetical protein